MSRKFLTVKLDRLPSLALASCVCFATISAASGQKPTPIKPPTGTALQTEPQEDESRQIYFDYAESRPKKPAAKGGKAGTKSHRRYTRRTPKVGVAVSVGKDAKAAVQKGAAVVSQVGVTVWRLRPSSASDEKETRILDQEETDESVSVELTPVRIEAETVLQVKDKVRLSIESPRAGYLYVIDREMYADGTLSAPYLIFPTLRTRGGDNKVTAGMLVDIPAQDDRPNYFTMKPTRPDQTGEQLTILVTTKPLDVPPLQRKYLRLPESQVAGWERQWKTEVERFEMEGGAGQAWTTAEKAAGGANGTRLLDQEDPAPQTIYRVAAKSGAPIIITVPLSYTQSASSSKTDAKPATMPK